ncbi:TolC family protein [Treponema sp.]|uniref:TolC family protein n=1 Tax=Treponema sp. TaxID=166 RepID=UPI00298E33DE|nr:TolC family protein [Treponema sp.]MCR5614263.1 TolC family protein [Treponema sp.]
MKKLVLIISIVLLNFTQAAFCQTESQSDSEKSTYGYEQLLCDYLAHDLELQKLTIEVEKAALAFKKTKIEQGIDVTLSSGTMTFYSGSAGTNISVKPSAKISVPSAKNLSVTASTDYQHKTSTKTNELKDTKLALSLDLISSTEAQSKIKVIKSEREYLEAKRKLQSAALSAEKSFYQELKNLLNSINTIFTNLHDVYTDTINFEKLKAQGYSSASSTYRLAEMKVSSGRHTIDSAVHKLRHDFVVFYKKCGITVSMEGEREFLKFIPSDIPDVDGVKFSSYDKEKFSEIEKANWTYTINSMERKADKNFSFGVNGGYTFANSTTKSDTVNAGIDTSWNGLGLNLGVSVPVGKKDFTPAFTVGASVNLNSFLTNSIKTQTYKLTEKQELLDIDTANENYETSVIDFDQQLENLEWEKTTLEENFLLYQRNEVDLKKYYDMGIVTQSEYLSARNNRLLYQVKKIINEIDMILYNNNVQSKFVDLDLDSDNTAEEQNDKEA